VFQEKYGLLVAVPHKFMALGHHDEDIARVKAVEVVEAVLAARAEQTNWDRMHPLLHFFHMHLDALAEFAAGQRRRVELPPDVLDKVPSLIYSLNYLLKHVTFLSQV
jgi:hypothetical protein